MKEQRKVIHDLWWKSFKNNRRRNVFIALAIALTTLLICSVIGLGLSFIEANEKQTTQRIGTVADANMNDLTDKQLELLKKDSSVEAVGIQRTIGAVESQRLNNQKVQMALHWYSKDEWNTLRKEAVNDFTGRFPEKENEIIAPLAALRELGIIRPKVGQKISLPYMIGDQKYTKDFTLSGYYKEYVIARAVDFSYVLVSDTFAEKYSPADSNTIYSVKYQNVDNINQNNKRLTKKLKLTSAQEIKPTVKESSQDSTSVIIGIAMFMGIILVSGGLLIYNVLYISIANDIRFYGLLKAVGTTKKQLRRIIFYQSLLLSAIGIPVGGVIGFGISQVLIPFVLNATNYAESIVVSTKPIIYFGAALFSLIVMLFSSIKPANYAAKVSPILAMSYTESKIKKQKVRSNKGGKLYFMAWRNIFRDRKRAVIVILSMSLGITSFVAVNTIVKSMDFEQFVVSEMDYDILINPSATSSKEKLSDTLKLEREQASRQLTRLIENSSGITDSRIYYNDTIAVSYDAAKFSNYIKSYNEYFKYGNINPKKLTKSHFEGQLMSINSKELEKLISKDSKQTFDKAAFEAGKIGFVQSDHPEDFADIPELAFSTTNQQPHLMKIGGFIPNNYLEIQTNEGAPALFVSEAQFKKMAPDAGIWSIYLNVEKKQADKLSTRFQSLIDEQSAYKIITKTEMKNRAQNEIAMMRMIGNTLALVLALIGLLNFVNIITTSILARRKELATLESIGMTRKQTNRVLMFEGGYYALIVSGIVLTFGMAVTYALFTVIKKSASYASFNLPVSEIGLALLLMFVICLFTPYLVMKSSSKSSLADRIKD